MMEATETQIIFIVLMADKVCPKSDCLPVTWSSSKSCGTISPKSGSTTTYLAPSSVKKCTVKATTQGMLLSTSGSATYSIVT